MTTVILTKTHIACDHHVVTTAYPTTTEVNLKHSKIFLSSDKQFIFAAAGSFYSRLLRDPVTQDLVRVLLDMIIEMKDEFDDNSIVVESKHLTKVYSLLMGADTSALLITKTDRFLLTPRASSETVKVTIIGDIVGLGTGGKYASGLVMGGLDIEDIWGHLVELEHLTSEAHSTIPLSVLKEYKVKKK